MLKRLGAVSHYDVRRLEIVSSRLEKSMTEKLEKAIHDLEAALEVERKSRQTYIAAVMNRCRDCETEVADLRMETAASSEALRDGLGAAMGMLGRCQDKSFGPLNHEWDRLVKESEEHALSLATNTSAALKAMQEAEVQRAAETREEFSKLRDQCESALRSTFARERSQDEVEKTIAHLKRSDEERNAQVRRLRWEFDLQRSQCTAGGNQQEQQQSQLQQQSQPQQHTQQGVIRHAATQLFASGGGSDTARSGFGAQKWVSSPSVRGTSPAPRPSPAWSLQPSARTEEP